MKKKKHYNFEKKKKKLSKSQYKIAVENLKKARATKRQMSTQYQQVMKTSRRYLTASEIHKLKMLRQRQEQIQKQKIIKEKINLARAYNRTFQPVDQTLRSAKEGISNEYSNFKRAFRGYTKEERANDLKARKGFLGVLSSITNTASGLIQSVGGNRGRPQGSISGKYISPYTNQPTDVITWKREMQMIKRQQNIEAAKREYYSRKQKEQNLPSADKDIGEDLTEFGLNDEVDLDLDKTYSGDPFESIEQEPVNPVQQKQRRNLERARYLNQLARARGKEPLYKENDMSQGQGFHLKARYKLNYGYSPFKNSQTPFKRKTNNLMSHEPSESEKEYEYQKDLRKKYFDGNVQSTRTNQRNLIR